MGSLPPRAIVSRRGIHVYQTLKYALGVMALSVMPALLKALYIYVSLWFDPTSWTRPGEGALANFLALLVGNPLVLAIFTAIISAIGALIVAIHSGDKLAAMEAKLAAVERDNQATEQIVQIKHTVTMEA